MINRYKLRETGMTPDSRGEWVKFKDVAEALNIVGDLAGWGSRGEVPVLELSSYVQRARIFMEGE